jgi:putative membrane protein
MPTDNINPIEDFDEKADPRNDLAIERTELALERTHLAWIRTLLTLITAGFAIDKGIEWIHEKRLKTGEAIFKNAHIIGILLTSIGSALILLQTAIFLIRSYQLVKMRKGRYYFLSASVILSLASFLLGCVITYFLLVY